MLGSGERVPRLQLLTVKDDRDSSAVGSIPGQEPVEHHRKVLGDGFGHGFEPSQRTLATGTRVRKDTVKLLPQNDRSRRVSYGLKQVARALPRDEAVEFPGVAFPNLVQIPPTDADAPFCSRPCCNRQSP